MILDIIREKSVCQFFKISFDNDRYIVVNSCQKLTPESSRRYANMLENDNLILNGNQIYNKNPFYIVYGISNPDDDLISFLGNKYNTIENLFENIVHLEPVNCEEYTEITPSESSENSN